MEDLGANCLVWGTAAAHKCDKLVNSCRTGKIDCWEGLLTVEKWAGRWLLPSPCTLNQSQRKWRPPCFWVIPQMSPISTVQLSTQDQRNMDRLSVLYALSPIHNVWTITLKTLSRITNFPTWNKQTNKQGQKNKAWTTLGSKSVALKGCETSILRDVQNSLRPRAGSWSRCIPQSLLSPIFSVIQWNSIGKLMKVSFQ